MPNQFSGKTRWDEFNEAYIPEPNSGCWLWIGAINNRLGYGTVVNPATGRAMPAHRASYLKTHGSIPDGMDILHRCDVRCCVNPDHLFPGTHTDNMRDMMKKGRHRVPLGAAHGKAKLTADAVRAIRASTEPHKVLADRYATSVHNIHTVRDRRSWQHLSQIPPGKVDGE